MKVFIGCSGWYYRDWKGIFYPNDISTSQWFKHYTKHFKTVELNAPFYRWPKPATVKTWVRQAPEGFVYCVKANSLITHLKRFQGTKAEVREFSAIADVLGEKMGCFLFQLPPSMKYDKKLLANILSQLDHTRKNVVEFRHKSWW